MTLTAIEVVRLKTADKSAITREKAKGNGSDVFYKLGHDLVMVTPALEVRLNDVLQVSPAQYSANLGQGVVEFVSTPIVNDQLEFTYYWSIFSDDEIQYFIDEAGGNTTIAAAKLLLAWAADAARLAKRQTLSGGGGLGQVVVDTSVAARELRETAKALIGTEQELGESIPAEGFTEIPWTEAMYKRQIDQHYTRDN